MAVGTLQNPLENNCTKINTLCQIGESIMQTHMKKLVEIVKDIDGFKEEMAYSKENILNLGGLCRYGRRKTRNQRRTY